MSPPTEKSNLGPVRTPPPLAPGRCPFGNTFQFLEDTTGLLVSSYKRLGPIYRLRALWLKYTVIGGFEARDFMRDGLDDENLTREAVFAEVGRQLGAADFVLGQSGEKHARLRRILSLAYSREVASPWVPQMIESIRELTRSWVPGTRVRVMDFVQRASFEQYCRVMCGISLGEYYRDCLRVTDYNMNVGGRVWPFFMYKMPWYQASRRKVLDLVWGLVRQRRAMTEAATPPTIMDTLLGVRDAAGNPLTEDDVVCYSMYGFAGSSSYMGRLVGFLLYELCRHPAHLMAIRAEIDRGFADGMEDATDVRGLKRLQAFYHESLRFHPVSQGMPHMAAKDFTYRGHQVNKGDLVVLSQVPMSFSECPFRDPERFDPERCLEPRNEHRRNNAFHPFGIGHRTCTAVGLVELMALTQVATLLRDFELEMDPANYQLKLRVRPLPAPDDRFHLQIIRRRKVADHRPAEPVVREDLMLADLPENEDPVVQGFLSESKPMTFAPGEVIVQEGDLADAFFVLIGGSVRITRRKGGMDVELDRLGSGACFGEIGLLQSGVRTATVTAGMEGAQVGRIEGDVFRSLVGCSDLVSSELSRLIERRLAGQTLLEAWISLGADELVARFPEFERREYAAGAVVLREGDQADSFHLLLAGEVRILRAMGEGGENGEIEVTRLGPGRYFGETGLLTDRPRNATVRVSDEGTATVLTTGKDSFRALIEGADGTGVNLAQALLRRLRQTRQG